jgi:hypothetical protein
MLLAWTLAVYGTTAVVTESKLLAPIRAFLARRSPFLGALLSCALCFGFWAGAGYSLLGLSLVASSAPAWWPLGLRAFADGAAGAAVSWILATVVGTVTEVRFSLETWRFGEETRLADKKSEA